MEFNPLLGRRLTAMSVFEPWRERGPPHIALPLFGAITLEFGDMALFFKSPLRYARVGLNQNFASFMAPGASRGIATSYRPIVCDMDQLGFYRRMLQNRAGETQPFYWQSVLPESRHSLMLDNLPDLRRLFGQTLLGMNRVSDTAFELRFTGQDFPLWSCYRSDLDGAIQVSWADWNHRITEVAVTEPDHAFGWLHPNAPYPICEMSRKWPNIRRYIESATWEATLGQREIRCGDKEEVLLAIHEAALRLKFEQHPTLARRFAAIHFSIIGDCFGENAIQAMQRLRAVNSIIPAS
jgi:hypothetical protein